MNPTGPTSADLAAGHARLADFTADTPANYPAEQLHREVAAYLLGRLKILLATGQDRDRITALCDVLAVSDWRAALLAAQQAAERENETCRDAVADAADQTTARVFTFQDGFDIRADDNGAFRVECGLCDWTASGLAGFAAAWQAADRHADACDGSCRDAVADVEGLVLVTADGIDWRAECGLCNWTCRGFATRVAAEIQSAGHLRDVHQVPGCDWTGR